MADDLRRAYWRTNLVYLAVLLSLWFAVSLGAGVLFADELDAYRIGGFKLGFWFGQQGSILFFVAIIFTYVLLMNRLERRVAAEEAAEEAAENAAEPRERPEP